MKKITMISTFFIVILMSSLFSAFVIAEDKVPPMKAVKLSESVYMLVGKGGNIGVSIGEDGTFLIDDQFATSTDSILKEIESLKGESPRFVINTHWHPDHTGGNENMGKGGAIIVAHDNVRKRLMEDNAIPAFQMTTQAYPKEALPTVTYAKGVTFHLNNDTVNVIHLGKGHTDGDSIVHFINDNIVHTGDLFFNGFYPFIDVDHGGSLKDMLQSINQILDLIDDKTQIIPGHGPVANKADLTRYRDMLQTAFNSLSELKKQGKTLTQAMALKPLASLDADWSRGMFTSEAWIGIVYNGIE